MKIDMIGQTISQSESFPQLILYVLFKTFEQKLNFSLILLSNNLLFYFDNKVVSL